MNGAIDLDAIRRAVRDQGAGWRPVRYPEFEGLSVEELRRRTGMLRDPQRVDQLRARGDRPVWEVLGRPASMLRALPPIVDWRDRNGHNYVTSVKSQGNCGACVGFGTVATLESMAMLELQVELDLSDAEVFFCSGSRCGDGMTVDDGVDYVLEHGVSSEACFPYPGVDTPCSLCGGREFEAVLVGDWSWEFSVSSRNNI